MNGATGPSEERPFTLNIGTGSSNIAALLKQTETTVTVSWAGMLESLSMARLLLTLTITKNSFVNDRRGTD